jgi:organic hydroperoxide reductase OsmC/OhrA
VRAISDRTDLPAEKPQPNPTARGSLARRQRRGPERKETAMSTVKAYRFPVDVKWCGDRVTTATAPGKPGLVVVTPPEFKGGVHGLWSPEDLLVSSTASCYALTLVAIAERWDIPLRALCVRGRGHVEKREDGKFAFLAIELGVKAETDPEHVAAVAEAAARAKEHCLVSIALDAPVHVDVEVVAAEPIGAVA